MKKYTYAIGLVTALAIVISCNKTEMGGGTSVATDVYLDLPAQDANYYGASSPLNAQATLGRVLFYDTHLSLNNAVSCGSCHKQQFAFADNVQFSSGFENKLTLRNSSPIQNLNSSLVFGGPVSLFWDGRENNLQTLVTRPINNHVEMGIDNLEALPEKLAELPYYKDLFAKAYGNGTAITLQNISAAVAVFMSSITADDTRFDRFVKGEEELTALEQEGRILFNTKYGCADCHNPNVGGYTGLAFMDIGLDDSYTDKGRGVISSNMDDGKFKIPNLRNVGLTAPYMHDGRFKTLEDVIGHYSENINKSKNLDARLKDANGNPLRMHISDHEKMALIAFLNTLTDYDMVTDVKFSNPFKAK